MPRKTQITLGSTTYTVQELHRKKNRRWLQSLTAPLADAQDTFSSLWGADTSQIDGQEVAERVFAVGKQILGMMSTDRMLEAMYEYSPALADAREAIEDDEELYDSDVVDAFVKVLSLATPFGSVVTQVRGLISSGAKALQTPKS